MIGDKLARRIEGMRLRIVGPTTGDGTTARPGCEPLPEPSEGFSTSLVARLAVERGARAEAERAERRALVLLEGLDAIVWVTDAATGRFTFINQRSEAILGYPVARWLDEPDFWLQQCVHADDREYATANRARCLREGCDVDSEYRAVAASGRTVWLRVALRLTRDEQGRPHELCGQMWNISKRKKVERQLYTARRELAEQFTDLTYLHDLSTRLSPNLELGPLLEEILAAVTATQGAEMGLVRLFDPRRDQLCVAASLGIGVDYLTRVGCLKTGQMACGVAVATRRPVVIADITTDPAYVPYRDLARLGGYRAVYSTPLIARCGEIVGTIAIHFRDPHTPPDRQVRLVELYARQAADFVETAQLHRKLKEGTSSHPRPGAP